MVSLEGNNILAFYYLSASDICPDKIAGLYRERGGLIQEEATVP